MTSLSNASNTAFPSTSASASGDAGPLAGVVILDLSAYIAGPYGCTLLADQGAEVIKIEPPQGDNLRNYPSTLDNESRAFLGVNRGKLGVMLDLKTAAGHAALMKLVDRADVLVHNFRPAVPAKLGIAWETLHARNPRLIYCALTGYGDNGPMRDKAGYDQVLQSMSGICALQGAPHEAEIVYGSVVDYYAASMLAGSVSSALFARERTGKGTYVGVSLLSSALAMQSARMVWAESEPRERFRDMRSGGITGLHPTGEGSLYISANTPHFWAALCELIERPDLATDPRFDSVKKRAQHAEEIVPRVRDALRARSAREWEQVFGERVPCAAVRDIEDMFDHPQVLSQGLVETYDHPRAGAYRGLARPYRFGDTPLAKRTQAPLLGEHTQSVLAAVGIDASTLDAKDQP